MHVTTCTDKLIPQLNPRRPTFLVDQRYQARTDRTRSIPHPPLPVNRDIGVHPTVNASTLRPAIVPGDKDALFSLLELATTRGVARMWNKKERREKGERERRKKEGRKEGRKSPRERRRPTPAHRHCEPRHRFSRRGGPLCKCWWKLSGERACGHSRNCISAK